MTTSGQSVIMEHGEKEFLNIFNLSPYTSKTKLNEKWNYFFYIHKILH